MEQLEDTSLEEQARAAAAEWTRLQRANGAPASLRAFVARQLQQPTQGVDSFLGVSDRAFLARETQQPGDRLPAAQTRAAALLLQRAVTLGDATLVRAELETLLNSSRRHQHVNDLRSSHGEMLLHTAVLHRQLHVVQTLLELGASPHIPLPPATIATAVTSTPVNVTAAPCSVAPRSDNFRCSRLLHAGETTAVHYACAVGDLDILKLLLSRGKRSPTRSPLEGYRPGSLLLWAIASGHAPVVEFLLRTSIESDCSDEDGNNAFGIAALLLGHDLATLRSVLRVLAVYSSISEENDSVGIDVNRRNALGLTAFDVAESVETREALAGFGARTARVVPVDRMLRWDREAYRRDVRLSTNDPSRPRAAFLRQSSDT